MSEARRPISLAIGTRIGLQGDYNAPCGWEGILSAQVDSYVPVQRRENMDMGLLARRPDDVVILGVQRHYVGKSFLLLHRYDDAAWTQDDLTVHVYGLPADIDSSIFLNYETWQQQTEWLSAAATLCILEPDQLSRMAHLLLRHYSIL